jgi:AcrR family transcriptional regulator
MEAATALFIANGIEATTVDDIVARARVAKGTFYHYFATKNDVILALRDRFSQTFMTRVAQAMEACPPGDLVARLEGWIAAAVETYLGDFKLHDVVFHDFTHSHRRSKEKDAVVGQLAALLSDGEQAGAWSAPDAHAAAIVIFDGMHGIVDDAIAAGHHDRARLCRTLADLFLRMIGAAARDTHRAS